MQGVALAILANQFLLPVMAQASPPVIPGFYGKITLPTVTANQLPQLKAGGLQSNATVASSGASMTVTQTASRAIIDWDKFDIGVNASVYFSQKNAQGVAQTSWAALNRIYDINPSQIYGSLKADGRIYLLNQNGILFGLGSKVDVHTLVASSLKMDLQKLISTGGGKYSDDPANKSNLDIWGNPGQFLDETTSLNLTKFTRESWNGRSDNTQQPGGMIANAGTITSSGITSEQGGVFLIGGAVENHGTITAPAGQIALAAGNEVYLSPAYNAAADTLRQGALSVKVTSVASGNDALNESDANLIADQGMVGMYGNSVTQNGLIRSISTVKRNGTIELLAKERITTGAGSVTATPVTTSPELVNRTFIYNEEGAFDYRTWITLGGLDWGSATIVTDQSVTGIDHRGALIANGGNVLLKARKRVFLDNNSLIDVSGSRVDLKVSDKFITTVLTSTELRDDQTQKYGVLKGAEVSTTTLSGTSIGNLSSLTELQQATALQWTTDGGSIEITAPEGDIVMKGGATVDISGGVTGYSSGDLGQTVLVYGTKIYGIADAPKDLTYTRILGDYTRTFERFGVQEKYKGLWTGGANPLFNPLPAFEEGGNAGKLTLKARQLLLDGQIKSSVYRGLFQTRLDEIRDSVTGKALTRGLKMPDGGTLILGELQKADQNDQKLDSLLISASETPQTGSINSYNDKPFSTPTTSMSSSVISGAKLSMPDMALSSLQINTNSTFTTAAGSTVALLPGAELKVRAQRIEHNGAITIPSGNVSLTLLDHVASYDGSAITLQDPALIRAVTGSSMSVAGLQNRDPLDVRASQYINGGSIALQDETLEGKGILLEQGAILSVDGGFAIDKKGAITSGNAGSMTLKGSRVDLQGDISGISMPGKQGGSLAIQSNWMTLANQSRSVADGVVLGIDKLLSAGFASLDLTGVFGLTVEGNVALPVRIGKMTVEGGRQDLNYYDFPDSAGNMTLKLTAGKTLPITYTNDYVDHAEIPAKADLAHLEVQKGATLEIAPGGKITLAAPAITMDGLLRSKGGSIDLSASGVDPSARDLQLGSSAHIDVSGYNRPVVQKLGNMKFYETSPRDGGSISLASAYGKVSMAQGAVADVSGSIPVSVSVLTDDGFGVGKTVAAASAGSIAITGTNLDLQGSLLASTYLGGASGGSLKLGVLNNDFSLTGGDIQQYQRSGFDAFTFASNQQLNFVGSMNLQIGRSLTLDAPRISATAGSTVDLSAPWINLTNSSIFTRTAESGTALLRLSGNAIDLSGSVALDGFRDVILSATADISATESRDQMNAWHGNLTTAGDLTLQAARVYPKNYLLSLSVADQLMPSEFDITSTGGTVTILSSGGATDGYLDSAGGSLTIQAKNGINQSGYLAAPMGRISLQATGSGKRVYLAPGSITSTRGGSDPVQVGYLNSDGQLVLDKNNASGDPVIIRSSDDLATWRGTTSGVSIDTNNGEVVQAEQALLDISGGGSFFNYAFFPGAAGSVDPLKTDARMVVVPQRYAPLGGKAIYLSGGEGVAAGYYTVVPERYAFLPGALIVSDAGGYVESGSSQKSSVGYNILAGYMTEANTSVSSNRYRGYVVRTASDVRKEGEFTEKYITAGNGSNVEINGETILLDGLIRANALAGYQGGSISLAGTNMTVQNSGGSTTGGIDFSSAIPSQLQGTVAVSSDALSGQGFKSVTLGSTTATETLTFAEGSSLAVDGTLALQAKNLVEIKANSSLSGDTLALASPDGLVRVAEGTTLSGTKSIDFEVKDDLDVRGTLNTPLVNLTGDNILVNDGSGIPTGVTGLNLTPALWTTLNSFSPAIGLKSRNNLIFTSSASLTTAKDLTIDSAGFVANANDIAATVSAANLTMKNSGDSITAIPAIARDNTSLTLQANSISVDLSHPTGTSAANTGDISISGFKTTTLKASKDLALGGNGTLNSSGSLNLEAARITTAASTDRTNQNYQTYLPANVLVQAANSLTINQSTGTAGLSTIPGGTLAFKAAEITQAGTVEMQSGTLKFDATKSLTFANISKTLNKGSATGAGGSIVASAKNGALTIADGATLDVSAGSQGDAGSISLTAATGGVTVGANTLHGSGAETGGSFSMDSATFGDTGALQTTLARGGFTEQINLRGRTGDLTVADSLTGDEITARRVSLAADAGKLTLEGQINTGRGKGQVELYSNDDLTLAAGSSVTVTGGGEANLGSSSSTLTLADATGGKAKALLDLSDGNGTANLRALQDTGRTSGLKMTLNGEIRGASEVVAEAVKVYTDSDIRTADQTVWKNATNSYMANANSYRNNLLAGLTMANQDDFRFRPGVEIQSSTGITLNNDWNLTGWRYLVNGKSETGLLTLRATGALDLAKKLEDKPSAVGSQPYKTMHSSIMKDSWDLRLVAGADGANPLSVNQGSGDLTVTGGVYTENGDISFASGNNTTITTIDTTALTGYFINNSLKYTLASYGGNLRGEIGNDLILNAGVIQSSLGDILLNVGGNLNMNGNSSRMGAIRTTGEAASASDITKYWKYANGGDVSVAVDGGISSTISTTYANNPWDKVNKPDRVTPYWSADYETSGGTRGIAAMAGGNVDVSAGGAVTAQIGVFAPESSSGAGNLQVASGGNLNGRFMSGIGDARFTSQGSFGGSSEVAVVSAMYTKDINISAQNDVWLGTVDNPTVTHKDIVASRADLGKQWNMTYLEDSSLSVSSLTGNINLTGEDRFYKSGTINENQIRVLPASLHLNAAGDINLLHDFMLAPSVYAELTIAAGGDITGAAGKDTKYVGSRLQMSDIDPAQFYNAQPKIPTLFGNADEQTGFLHSDSLTANRNTANPIVINAGGDITNLELNLVKSALISAAGDITDLRYLGQNIKQNDLTSIMAGGSIVLNTAGLNADSSGVFSDTGFQHGGPGYFIVKAGSDIDLGGTRGIQAYGNHRNAGLSDTGSDLFVLAGVSKAYRAAEISSFFEALKSGAQEYSKIKADGDADAAATKLAALQTGLIAPFIKDALDENGTLNMVSSQISTLTGSNISIMTGNTFNVGKSTFYGSGAQKNTGVYTAMGGDINVFSRGDVNVNESRLMTFYGGDITVWSEGGVINAGRGSKAAINPSQALKVVRDDGSYITRFSPPSVGSGVRAMTYNADNGKPQPEAGDITLVARVVDAGEAGIFGNKVYLVADEVRNASNISSVGISVGVPVQTESSAGIGSLSGSGTLNEGARMLVETTAMGNKNTAEKLAKADSFFAAWLDVKVLGFDENPPN